MGGSMLIPRQLHHDIGSSREFEEYLERQGWRLATNHQIDAPELLMLSMPDWAADAPQGCVVLFVPKNADGTIVEPERRILSKFLAGMCFPFDFVTEGNMRKDQIVYVHLDPEAMVADHKVA
jgi:hypothetical protein